MKPEAAFIDDLIEMMFGNMENVEIDDIFQEKAFLGLEETYTAHQRLLLQSWGKVKFEGTEIDAMGVLAILQYVTDVNQRAVDMIVEDSNECHYLNEDIVTDFWIANLAMQKEILEKKNILHGQVKD